MTNFYSILPCILWISLILIFHSYFGIYLYLKIVSSLKSSAKNLPPLDERDLPLVTVLCPAYNEEVVIEQKIMGLIAQNYPKEKLNIVIASDCSTDRTVEIVKSYHNQGIELIEMIGRHGKNGIDDVLIPDSKGEIVIVTDANTMLEPNAIRNIVERFLDPTVGAACGNVVVVAPRSSKNLEGESLYRDFELAIRKTMSTLGLVIGGYGGFYALRRDLYRPLGKKPVAEDMAVLMEVLAQKFKVVFADDAIAIEESASSVKREFFHRMRISAFNWGSIRRLTRLAFKAGPHAFYLFLSWKILRWISPMLWLIVFISTGLLLNSAPIYTLMAFVFGLGLSFSLLGWLMDLSGIAGGFITKVYHFAAMNLASGLGLFKWMKGLKIYWTPEVRQ